MIGCRVGGVPILPDDPPSQTAPADHATTRAALLALIEAVRAPVLVVDAELRLVAANPAFAALTGWPADQLEGLAFAELFGATLEADLAGATADGWGAARAYVQRPDGGLASPVQLRASRLRLPHGGAGWAVRVAPRPLLAPIVRRPTDPTAGETALQRLAAAARRSGAALGGCHVRVIGLARARARAGARWPQLRRRIALICEGTIAAELAPEDVFVATELGDYLVGFACAETAEADRRAAHLQLAIDRRLLGEAADAVGHGHGAPNPLREIAVDVRGAAIPAPEPGATVSLLAWATARIRAKARADEDALARRLAWLQDYRFMVFQPVSTRAGRPTTLLRASCPAPEIDELLALGARSRDFDAVTLALDLRRLDLLEAALGRGAIDRRTVILDVTLPTIETRRAREALLQRLRPIAGFAKRWLVPNLVGVPPGTYRGRLRDALSALKPISRGQALTLPPVDLARLDLTQMPCRLFVAKAAGARHPLAPQARQRLVDGLRRARARLLLDGSTEGVLADAIGAELVVAAG